MISLEKLRAKSDGAKKMISIFGAGAITLMIAGIWVSTLPARLSDTSDSAKTAAVANALQNAENAKDSVEDSAPSPLDSLKAQFANFPLGNSDDSISNENSGQDYSQNLDQNSLDSTQEGDYSGAVIISDPVLDSASN